ncbi:MAG: RNA polymerase sigma factor [Spirochaetaceae bacterium]|nr:MAG: RNA polymerase sigma factor [Spirochaetaceae bacterium]
MREDLFDKAYESLYPILFRIAYRITGSSTKAEDLCHEAFIKYWQREEPLPDLEQTKYWLIRVLRNISLNYEKKRSREQRAYGRLQKSAPQYSKSTDQEFFKEQTRSVVQEALNKLPAKMKMVLVMKEYGDLNYKEIADILGISEGNVKVRAFRARERLAQLLDGEIG